MKRNLLSPLVLTGMFSLLLLSCSKTDMREGLTQPVETSVAGRSDNNTTYYGPVVQAGNGQVRSFAVLEKQTDKPIQIGFELSTGALANLPGGEADHHEASFVVALHPKVKAATVFDHLVADWNSSGHEPGPYLLPHFDFHFYMLSLSQRLAITASDPLSVAPLPADYLPADYIGPLGPEPQMGGHCVDITSPELGIFAPPQTFTHTFIYGAYDSKVVFYEPMVTHDYLSTGAGGTFTIKQPMKFSKAGYYPTSYSITKDASGNRYVVLSGFVYRQAD
jgi:hypothetical protein